MKARTKVFALRTIRLTESLPTTGAAGVIGKQLLRSGTSIGANYRAACRGKSTADFVAKLGNMDKLGDIMSPGKTVSKLRSTPAPYLAQVPTPKLGVGVDLNRDRVRVSCLLGPDTVLTRSRPHRGTDPTSPRSGLDLTEMGARLH